MRTDDTATADGHGGADPTAVALELSRLLLAEQSLHQVLERVAHLSREALPEIDEVSVTVVEGERPRSVVFTGPLAVDLDERQYDIGFGPCLDAARTGQVVRVPDTATDTRYPDFARQAARNGVTRSLSIGMPVPGRSVGGLNLYARQGRGFDERTVRQAESIAAHAAVAVANAALYARTAEQVEQMEEAMTSRATIEQAKGMLMAARGCSADDAFAELRQRSRQANRKLRDVAQEVVDSRGRAL